MMQQVSSRELVGGVPLCGGSVGSRVRASSCVQGPVHSDPVLTPPPLALLVVDTSVQFSPSVVSDSLRPHGLQPTRLLRPWDFPGKSTGVGCHCRLHSFH